MRTDWLSFYEERRRFRKNMKGFPPEKKDALAFLDTTKAIQNKEGLTAIQANQKLSKLIESR